MFPVLLFATLLWPSGTPPLTAPTIRQIQVQGNHRIPTPAIIGEISLAPGNAFDAARLQSDIRKLFGTGLVRNVAVSTQDAGPGQIDLIYRVQEFPFISAFVIEGVNAGLEEQIRDVLRKEKLEMATATPFRPREGKRASVLVRNFLRTHCYPNAEAKVVNEPTGDTVRVRMDIRPGARVAVGQLLFAGNSSIRSTELLNQMEHSRPSPFWTPWLPKGRYVPEEFGSDLERIRQYYQSKGFANVAIGKPELHVHTLTSRWPIPGPWKGSPKLAIRIPIEEGPLFQLASVELEGDLKAADAEIHSLMNQTQVPGRYDFSALQSIRQNISDALGRRGYALARVELQQAIEPDTLTVRAIYKITAGEPVVVGRIDFEGNRRVPDKFLRRELRAAEGEVFDLSKLDRSIERLNRGGLVQELKRADVSLRMDEEKNLLDITFRVKEKDRQGVYATGGTGGVAGGYLGVLYTAFNLLGVGEMLSAELDGGASQSNFVLDMVGNHFLGFPFSIGLSAFHRLTDYNVSSIVPGPQDLLRVLTRRSTGVGLSGSYPITTKVRVGGGMQLERLTVFDQPSQGPSLENRSGVAPFLTFDSTRGTGTATRGSRVALSHSWSGPAFFSSVDSTTDSFQISRYAGDPWTHGRNAIAFRLQGTTVRPHNGQLALERRLFPGDESVRGFRQGGLTPWIYAPASATVQPAGADTAVGTSVEYRVPIGGALSGIAFLDLGWSHLAPEAAGASILEETNGLLRASLGGELRCQIPMLNQPARLIFSWNPLRLHGLLSKSPSITRIADSATSVRFALGSLF